MVDVFGDVLHVGMQCASDAAEDTEALSQSVGAFIGGPLQSHFDQLLFPLTSVVPVKRMQSVGGISKAELGECFFDVADAGREG